jgi:hypothetical protein
VLVELYQAFRIWTFGNFEVIEILMKNRKYTSFAVLMRIAAEILKQNGV